MQETAGKEETPQNVEEPSVTEKASRKKKQRLLLAAAALFAAVLAAAAFLAVRPLKPKTQYALDRDALEGFLPNKTQEEIEAELNRIIDESRFNVSINPTPVIEDGRINIMIENIPANHYWMQVDVFIQEPDKEQETLVYRSGLIKQGYYIENADVAAVAAPGQYNGRAVFSAIKPESDEEVGQTEATMVVYVGEGQ